MRAAGRGPTVTDDVRDDDRPPVGEVVGPIAPWAVAALAAAATAAPLGVRAAPVVAAAVADGAAGAARVVVALLVACVAGAVVLAARRGTPRGRGTALLAVVAVVLAAAAAARTATHELGLLPRLAAQGGSVEVAWHVAAEPRPLATGWHVPVVVTTVAGARVLERAAVTLDPGTLERPPFGGRPPALGTRWTSTATARPLPDGGYGDWLRYRHLTVVLDVGRPQQVGEGTWLARSSETVRDRTRQAAVRRDGDATGGLLVGLATITKDHVNRRQHGQQDASRAVRQDQ